MRRVVVTGMGLVSPFGMGFEHSWKQLLTGRSAAHDINIVASWLPDDPEPERHKAWARTTWKAMRPYADGVYVNFMSDEPASHVQLAYGDSKYARLVALKSKYDPTNVFRFNQNIAPAD